MSCPEELKVHAETGNLFYILLVWEAQRCHYQRLVNLKFLVYNQKSYRSFRMKLKTENVPV